MTKEELEKEAEEYATENYEQCIYDDVIGWQTDYEARKQAYIAGAASREKRIEQLEKEIKRLETELAITDNDREHNYYECLDLYKKVEELNNELAELEQRVPKCHDLRKDPKDLPKEYMGFLLVKTNIGTYRLDMFINNGFMQDMGVTKTIAWCELPKFEEE